MKIELTTAIPVERVAALAELAFIERRPELGLLCRAARESGRLGEDEIGRALPDVSRSGARNILRWCHMLGLCHASGALTRAGEQAADTDDVPVPEQGVYELSLAEHPLLGRRIVHARRLAARQDGRFEDMAPLPLEPERGRVFRSLVDRGQRVVFRHFPGKQPGCVRRGQDTLRLCWMLDVDGAQDRWHLHGAIGDKDVAHEPESASVDGWAVIAELGQFLGPRGQWDERGRRLRVRFVDDEDAAVHFLARIELGAVRLQRHGEFQAVALHDVPLAPATRDDAAAWARARLDRRLAREPRYRTRDDVRGLWAGLVAGTPLADFEPELPAHHELVAATHDPAMAWRLAAPVDLAPEPVSAAALGPYRPARAGEEAA